jgi:hypothetical protein
MKLLLPVILGCFALTSLPARAADEKKDESAAASGRKVVVIELWGIH